MKKTILLSLFLIEMLSATNKITIPISNKYLSTDNNGVLSAYSAYRDGVGLFISTPVTDTSSNYDNSDMNNLVYIHGEVANDLQLNLKEVIASTNPTVDTGNIGNFIAADKLITNGQSCNDNNSKTINDIYTNGVCAGTNVEGKTCNDNNAGTVNDKYVNGLCIGTMVPNGTVCNDNNAQTINDIYTNGICTGTNVEGQSCNDNNSLTSNDTYHNGLCVGESIIGQLCDDNKFYTENDKYSATGVCEGTEIVFGTNYLLKDAYPTNTTNWTYSNGTYYSTGDMAAKLFTLPTTGKVRIELIGSRYLEHGIAKSPKTTSWGNNYIGSSLTETTAYNISNFYGEHMANYLSSNSETYIYYLDMNAKKGTIIRKTTGQVLLNFTFFGGTVYFGLSDAFSSYNGNVKFTSVTITN